MKKLKVFPLAPPSYLPGFKEWSCFVMAKGCAPMKVMPTQNRPSFNRDDTGATFWPILKWTAKAGFFTVKMGVEIDKRSISGFARGMHAALWLW